MNIVILISVGIKFWSKKKFRNDVPAISSTSLFASS
jgi:hypothetical protein